MDFVGPVDLFTGVCWPGFFVARGERKRGGHRGETPSTRELGKLVDMKAPIRRADPREPLVAAMIGEHLAEMAPTAPSDSRHAYPAAALSEAGIALYAAEHQGRPVALGALHFFAPGRAELKSMRTDVAHRSQGLGRSMLDHLIDVARRGGIREILLETGTHPQFAPARAMYAAAGFEPCAPFDGYCDDPHSVYLRLGLTVVDAQGCTSKIVTSEGR